MLTRPPVVPASRYCPSSTSCVFQTSPVMAAAGGGATASKLAHNSRRSIGGVSYASSTPEGLSLLSPGLVDKYACPSSSEPSAGGEPSLASGAAAGNLTAYHTAAAASRWPVDHWRVKTGTVQPQQLFCLQQGPADLNMLNYCMPQPGLACTTPSCFATPGSNAPNATPPSPSQAAAPRPPWPPRAAPLAATCGWITAAAAATPPTCPSLARRPVAPACQLQQCQTCQRRCRCRSPTRGGEREGAWGEGRGGVGGQRRVVGEVRALAVLGLAQCQVGCWWQEGCGMEI